MNSPPPPQKAEDDSDDVASREAVAAETKKKPWSKPTFRAIDEVTMSASSPKPDLHEDNVYYPLSN